MTSHLPAATTMNTVTLKKTLCICLFTLISVAGRAYGQSQSTTSDKTPTSVGLALSGGGAKGFAHIGVLKVFEQEGIPVHMISGTSMGSIVGSLYAIGYTPKEIEDIALSTDWSILFNDSYRINPQNIANSVSSKDTYLFTFPFNGKRLTLPSGLIDGQNIGMLLYRLMLPYHDVRDFTQLPIPFAAVATNLSTGEAHTFTGGYLPDAVRASIAIPTIFKPVTINGQTYIDGGVARNIPVEDVRSLGANLVIASDVGEPIKSVDSLNTFVDVLFQSVGFHQQESDIRQRQKTDFYIRPDITSFSTFSYNRAKEIIKSGEQAARKLAPQIKSYLKDRSTAVSRFESIRSAQDDSLVISDISYSNIGGLLQQQARLALDIQPPAKLTLAEIEQKVNRLYSSGLFSQISYRLLNHSDDEKNRLLLEFQQKEQEYAGFSVRYDSQYKASLLFGASLTDNIYWSDRLTLQLRAGEVLELNATYSAPLTLAPLSKANFGLDFQRSPIDIYSQDRALSTINVERITFRPSLTVRLLERTNLEGGIEAEVYNLNQAVGNTLFLENTNFLLNPFFKIDFSTLNRPYFPTRGHALKFESILSDRLWGSVSNFMQLSGQWFSTIPLTDNLNLSGQLFTGYTSGNPPLHYDYYLGGMAQNPIFDFRQLPFMGHAAQQLRTGNVISIQSQLQFKLGKNIYLSGGMDWAHLSDKWTFNISKERMEYGYSLSLGATSILGPLELSLSTPDFKGGYALKIDLGYHF